MAVTRLGQGGADVQLHSCRSTSAVRPSKSPLRPQRRQPAVRVCAAAPSQEFKDSVIIVGGGIGGLAAALGLQRVGIPAVVLEKAAHLREAGAAIMMQSNAWRALHELGVADELRATHMEIDRLEAYKANGQCLKGVNVKECKNGPHEWRGLLRNDLQATLAAAVREGVVCTSASVTAISHSEEGPIVELEDGTQLQAKVVVGADGAGSKVAASLGLPRPEYAGWAAYRGMSFFDEGLPNTDKAFRMIMGGPEGKVVGFYPVSKFCAYYFCGFPCSKDFVHQFNDKAAMRTELMKLVQGLRLPDTSVEEVVANTPDSHLYLHNVGDRKVVAGGTLGRGCVTVIGDAAHPSTPALGQGGCMALEDAVTLAATLRNASRAKGASVADAFARTEPAVLAAALRDMERERTTRCAPLVQMAHDNGESTCMPKSLPGVWFRNFMISTFGYNPETHLEYTNWWPTPL